MSPGLMPPASHRCVVTDCEKRVQHGLRLCSMHYQRLRTRGDVNDAGKQGSATGRIPKLTTAECNETRRLANRFVAPLDIAKRLDVSESTVRRVLKGTYKPSDAA